MGLVALAMTLTVQAQDQPASRPGRGMREGPEGWGTRQNDLALKSVRMPGAPSFAGCPILRAFCEGWDSTVVSRLGFLP